MAFRDVTPERMRRPLSVLVVNWRNTAFAVEFPQFPFWNSPPTSLTISLTLL